MPPALDNGVVVYRSSGDIDAIAEYSRRLAAALGVTGVDARNVRLRSALSGGSSSWIALQYNPFSWGRAGFAPGLIREAARFHRASDGVLALMVHEAWIEMVDAKTRLIGSWQRAQLGALLRLADVVLTSTEALAVEIGHGAIHLPVPSNITPLAVTKDVARERVGLNGELTVALFGRGHPSRALHYAESAIDELARSFGPERLAVLNLGAGAPPVLVPRGVRVSTPGPLTADELSLGLLASDLVLLPLSDGVSTRRSTLMAALAHGRAVLGLSGHNTDAVLAGAPAALALTPAGNPAAFSRAAVELVGDPARLRALGDAGRELYESQFDWPVLAQRLRSVLDETSRAGAVAHPRSRSSQRTERPAVALIAHDVGGPGGMERQTEELVLRLLERGHAVTVIARTCELAERAGLRFVRVRTPRRPFVLAYPAFFLVGSLLARRRSHMLLHANGAIVANPVDVVTVHYCHRVTPLSRTGLRASRPGPLHWLNALSARFLSRAGETWCYRPGRARLLCAVSPGVARELRDGFPAMRTVVQAVPNGVDCDHFRPDAQRRAELRTELGLGDDAPLALFVGGDWERKGLAHVLDAIARAPGWHLIVAGAGPTRAYAERARRAGIAPRVHFLGLLRDLRGAYAAADVFVLPTAYETFSLASFEAAASGLPLLVCRVSGVEDLLRSGVNGWFIERDGQDIARSLNSLSSNRVLAARMGAQARAAAARYSWASMADRYAGLYAELDDAPARC